MNKEDYNITVFYLISFLSFLIICFFVSRSKTWQEKLVTLLLLGGTTFYSGLGIANRSVSNSYIQYFLFFIIFEGIGLIIGYKIFSGKKSFLFQNGISNLKNKSFLLDAFAVMYWFIIVFLLVYSIDSFSKIFSVRMDLSDVFEKRIQKREDMIVYICGLLLYLLLPFYCLFLQKKKKIIIILLIILEKYCTAVTDGYIGRTEIMMTLAQVVLIWLFLNRHEDQVQKNTNESNEKKNKKRLVVALTATVLLFFIGVPFWVSYQYTRRGLVSDLNIFECYVLIFDAEINYPTLYEYVERISGRVMSLGDYLYWFFTLPLPKELISLPKPITLNYAFTEYYTRVYYGDLTFSVVLVSLMGEGILICGKALCYFYGLFIGLVWGALNSFLSSKRDLIVLQTFFIVKTINLIRGGSQGALSGIINMLLPFIVVLAIFNMFVTPAVETTGDKTE